MNSTLKGFPLYTNMASVSLFWNINMAAMTSCENAQNFKCTDTRLCLVADGNLDQQGEYFK